MTQFINKLQLQAELNRCLQCKSQPCMNACPVSCNPREFIAFARANNWPEAVHAITRNNPMGLTCGLICPDKFCMAACTRAHIDFPINIPKIQAAILHTHRTPDQQNIPEPNGKKVAIIGAGPAGMAAASRLVRAGFRIEIFEARKEIGGALNMIPDERLPHDIIEEDWKHIHVPDRITLHLNAKVDNPSALADNFDAVIVATGEPNCTPLKIPGEELSTSYMDYLYDPQKFKTSGNVAVIGGGNVAADCAMTAIQLGAASVEMFIRRGIADMKISRKDFLELLEKHIQLNGMTSPVRIEQNQDHLTLWVRKNHFVDNKWAPLEDTTHPLPYFDLVIRAIGSRADQKQDDAHHVIYAGDCKTGGSTIVEAISSGLSAAGTIIATLLH